ncbi:MAG: hypothetical protein WC789_00230 [Lentisphaeria bacterium]|jgi:hypothetical protein
MDGWSLTGLLVCFACVIASRVLSERAVRGLTGEQKTALAEAFAKTRMWQLLPVATLVLLYLLFQWLGWFKGLIMGLYFAGLALCFIGLHVAAAIKLRRLQLPASYTRTYAFARLLVFLGFIFLAATLWVAFHRRQPRPATEPAHPATEPAPAVAPIG